MKVMSGLDARFLSSETKTAHMHTVKVIVLDASAVSQEIIAGGISALMEERLAGLPVLRRRVIPTPFGIPVMVDDPEFDISQHILHATVASPGGRRELDALVSEIAAVPLPRDRPLWELTVIDGLADGAIAFVMKLHHALADGTAAVAMLENAFVLDPAQRERVEFHPEPLPTSRDLYRTSLSTAASNARQTPGVIVRTIAGSRAARSAKREIDAPLPGPFVGPRTPFNVSLTSDRTFATLEVPIGPFLDAKSAVGATLNDAFLAMCGGAIRRYLSERGPLPTKSLVASVPMVTSTDHRLEGNRLDNLFVPIRNDIADPAARLRLIHQSAIAARQVRHQFGSDLFETRSGLMPSALHGVLPKLWASTRLANHVRPPLNLVASCVRGPRSKLEIDGSVVRSLYSSGPILEGIGLNITAWTYADRMNVSVLGCSASLPEPWRLIGEMENELASWAQVAGLCAEIDLRDRATVSQ